ncbi:unnamed protein product [Absidia cylindrospora]
MARLSSATTTEWRRNVTAAATQKRRTFATTSILYRGNDQGGGDKSSSNVFISNKHIDPNSENTSNKKNQGLNSKFRKFFQPLSADPSNEKLKGTCGCGTSAVQRNKFDPTDTALDGLLENNRQWAAAVVEEDPEFFKTIALQQKPKILWIGCSDSRVPPNQVLQLGPGEVFVHRNIANVVTHTDMSCLSVLQYSIEVLKIQHVIVCGHYNCGGVAAAYGKQQVGLIDNWLRNIKDVYRLYEDDINKEKGETQRMRRLVEHNAIHSAQNVCYSTIVQDAWKRGQKLTVHAWVHDIADGMARKLEFKASCASDLENIYKM